MRRTGLQISDAEAKAFVAKQSTGQIFQGRIPSDGKIVGGGRDDTRWQMDLIDYSKRIRKLSGKHRFVLVAVDLYDRTVFTQPMQNKTAETPLDPPTCTGRAGLGSGGAAGSTLMFGPEPWRENKFGYNLRVFTILPCFDGP